MVSIDSNSTLPPAGEGPKWRFLKRGVASILAVIALVCMAYYFNSHRSSVKHTSESFQNSTGELLSADAETRESSSSVPEAGLRGKISSEVRSSEARPFLELKRIIPFGRSLELVGRVEPGSRLAVNDESVEVTGDGYYKHFTNPFPASNQKVRLELKATDLAGRTRILTAVHYFSSDGGNN